MMERALADYLLNSVSITSLVGDRIYWTQLPQGEERPYLLLSVVSSIPNVVFEGANGLVQSRVQFDCWGSTFYQAKDLARAIDTLLNGKRHITSGTGAVAFEGFFLEAERDGHSDVDAPDDLFRTSLDFLIWHKGV